MDNNGRPEYTDEQYYTWLNDLAPFLKLGNSLYHAMEKAGLLKHKDSIYKKVRLNDWFCEKVEAYKRYPGEIVNSIFVRLITTIDEKTKQGVPLSDEDYRNLRWFAEKHRSCQPFFVNKHEVNQTSTYDPEKISQLLDELEEENSNANRYEHVAAQAQKELDRLKAEKGGSIDDVAEHYAKGLDKLEDQIPVSP